MFKHDRASSTEGGFDSPERHRSGSRRDAGRPVATWAAASEAALATEMNVSRGPVREALFATPDLTVEMLYEQHDAYVRYLSGDNFQTAETIVRAHAGL